MKNDTFSFSPPNIYVGITIDHLLTYKPMLFILVSPETTLSNLLRRIFQIQQVLEFLQKEYYRKW